MHDCYIRVTALLEYFEYTPSKQHSRSEGQGCGFSVPLFYPCYSWGQLLLFVYFYLLRLYSTSAKGL